MEVRHYVDNGGRDIYQLWVNDLRDTKARIRIVQRVLRLEAGNFGDVQFCREGVWEMRIHYGPGYRVYYALDDQTVVVLLYGGDKSSQARDITRAVENWQDYKLRMK